VVAVGAHSGPFSQNARLTQLFELAVGAGLGQFTPLGDCLCATWLIEGVHDGSTVRVGERIEYLLEGTLA
jgi:hypothetical protein